MVILCNVLMNVSCLCIIVFYLFLFVVGRFGWNVLNDGIGGCIIIGMELFVCVDVV